MVKKIFLFALFLCLGFSVKAQTMTESDHVRRGNRHYADSLFEKAEIEYRKALELNPQSVDAMYTTAAKLETDKGKLAKIYHNMGTLNYMSQQYAQSVEAYKESLRNNPTDHETRYNLAKAMHMLEQQQNQQQNEQNQEQQNQEQQQQQNQEQQQDQQQEQQQQNQQQNEQQNQEQQQQEDQQKENPQQSQQEKEQISKENAEQMLNAVMQDEKEIQEKAKRVQQQNGKILDKDW